MAVITETELKKQIKARSFSPIYILYGTEQMFVKRATEMLVTAVAGKSPSDFNYHTFGGEVDMDTLAAATEVVPFASEYNCVVVTDIFLDTMNAEDIGKFKEICKRVIEGTVLIISMPSYMPKRNLSAFTSIVKRAEKDGSVCHFEKTDRRTIERYIAKWVNEHGKTISQINASKLIAACGEDLYLLKNEVDKICAYSKGETVELDAIEKLVSTNLEAKIFAMSDAVLAGNGDAAFGILDRLFYQKEEPMMMLYALSNSFIDAYRIRVADECGVLQEQVAKDFAYKNRAFTLGKARKSTSRVSTQALRQCLDVLIEADTKFKSVSVNARLYLEQLISELLLIAREGKI